MEKNQPVRQIPEHLAQIVKMKEGEREGEREGKQPSPYIELRYALYMTEKSGSSSFFLSQWLDSIWHMKGLW